MVVVFVQNQGKGGLLELLKPADVDFETQFRRLPHSGSQLMHAGGGPK